MRRIIKNFNLKKFNTFNIDSEAEVFFMFTDIIDLKAFLKNEQFLHLEKRVLGGGSNVLITGDYKGAVIHPMDTTIKVVSKNKNSVSLKVGAGTNWDDFVAYCVKNNLYGIENLSGIPGNVGAAPIQNIGAYGVEVKDFIRLIEYVELDTHKINKIYGDECNFGYRDSIFKHELRNKVCITAVTFTLNTEENLKLNYRGVEEEIKKLGKINAANLRNAILTIREKKLPKPEEMPNAGSFFKNPILEKTTFNKLQKKNPDIPFYTLENDLIKIPAAWLIEKTGFKGFQNGKTAVHNKQPLVLINKSDATSKDILKLSEKIIKKIKKEFGIELEKEVNLFP